MWEWANEGMGEPTDAVPTFPRSRIPSFLGF